MLRCYHSFQRNQKAHYSVVQTAEDSVCQSPMRKFRADKISPYEQQIFFFAGFSSVNNTRSFSRIKISNIY